MIEYCYLEDDKIPKKLKEFEPKSIKIYISGGITGLPKQTAKENFANASKKIKELGFDVCNPFREVRNGGYNWFVDMSQCFELMSSCDAILMLDGWERSCGANIELAAMISQGKPAVTMENLIEAARYWQYLDDYC